MTTHRPKEAEGARERMILDNFGLYLGCTLSQLPAPSSGQSTWAATPTHCHYRDDLAFGSEVPEVSFFHSGLFASP